MAYSDIIAKYWELFNGGKLPVVGDRNALTFELAVTLRSICGYSLEGLQAIVPNYWAAPDGTCTEADRTEYLHTLKNALKDFNYFLDETPAEEPNNELELLKNELTAKQNQFDKACEMLEQGIYTIERFKTRSAAIQQEIETIKNRINEIETAPKDDIRAKNAIPILEKVLEKYETLDRTAKNKILRSIINKITVTPQDDGFSLGLDLLL